MGRNREPSPLLASNPADAGIGVRQGRARVVAARHPVVAFLTMAFCLAYPVMALPILAEHGVLPPGWIPNLAGIDTERVASVLLVFVALLPASLFVTWAGEGSVGVRRLLRRAFQWRIGVGWWIVVLAGLPTLTLTLAMMFGDTFKPVDVAPFVLAQVGGLLVNLLLINIIEETGWAGMVQTRLERTHGLVVAALLTAIPFALVHMPLHFIGDFSLGSLTVALVTLLIVCAIVRLLLGVVLRGTDESILAVALTHTMFNRSNNDEGIVAGLVDGDGRKLAGLLAVLVLTVIVSLVSRSRLRRSERFALDDMASRESTQPITVEAHA